MVPQVLPLRVTLCLGLRGSEAPILGNLGGRTHVLTALWLSSQGGPQASRAAQEREEDM